MTDNLVQQWPPGLAGRQRLFRASSVNEEKNDRGTILQAVRRRLNNDSQFRGRADVLRYRFRQGVLVLRGILPSFYLKQLLQTALRDIPGVLRIVNKVEVNNPWGYENQRVPEPKHAFPSRR